ncbi:hypothetical protein XA68_13424 [Ophiocordyceps unilateralis]|uniref:Uncharacterized protein n=1 Tax=Ophiocordyceps unilateralis TaxID=268505 RepID=A0A2A9PC99_OPHUN|nr:hypothetical protein XA68_13424 [Ophiocordyceps unilateralis]
MTVPSSFARFTTWEIRGSSGWTIKRERERGERGRKTTKSSSLCRGLRAPFVVDVGRKQARKGNSSSDRRLATEEPIPREREREREREQESSQGRGRRQERRKSGEADDDNDDNVKSQLPLEPLLPVLFDPANNLSFSTPPFHSLPPMSLILRPRAHADGPEPTSAEHCHDEAVALGKLPLRIGAIFILLVLAFIAAVAPIMLSRQARMRGTKAVFFIFKFVGTGVILATAWMHLLAPAVEQLGDACVGHDWPVMAGYPWAFCIGLMTVMVMFLVELVVSTVAASGGDDDDDDGNRRHLVTSAGSDSDIDPSSRDVLTSKRSVDDEKNVAQTATHPRPPTSDVQGRQSERKSGAVANNSGGLAGQLTATLILEFGVVFHSVFIGLTLGTTADDEFTILLVVLVFHQIFEGLGLGSRLAVAPWPARKGWVPWVLALGFALSTPIGVAAALGAKPTNAATQKLVNGIFDAISAGILMYTGLVELLAHEMLFEPAMRRASLRRRLSAYGCVALGVFVMALLAKWA